MAEGIDEAKESVKLENDRQQPGSGLKTATLFQIYYRAEHLDQLYSFATPYFNYGLTIFFENSVIKELVTTSDAPKIGVCSWKLKKKLSYNIGKPQLPDHITEELINSDYELLPFTRNSKHHQMLAAAEQWHPGFKAMLSQILDYLQINMPSEVKTPINQNHFMARSDIYKDYVKRYLSPAMWLMKNEPSIHKMVMQDSNYTALAREDAASPAYLQDKIGVPYYPMAPFLLERLFSIYVHNEKIKVTFL